MKKLIAMFLVVVMMFSMTTIAYAKDADTQGQTTSSYMDYLEEKAENGNFFIRFIVKLVIVGVKLGWIKAEDLKGWFENDEPQNDDSPGDVTVPPLVDEEQEGIVELKLHHSQSLPYTSNGITITNVKVLREDDGYYKDDNYFIYRYSIIYEADGEPMQNQYCLSAWKTPHTVVYTL